MEANTIDSQESTNIQLGIKFFVSKSVEKENANMNKKKTKKVQVAAEASFEKKKNSRHPSSTLKRKRELSTLETEEPDSFAESTELLPTDTKKKKFSGTKECVPCEDEGVNETTVLKRSPKRKKQVPKAQKNKNSNTLVSKTNGNNKVAALDYLCQWEKDRSSWAFRKKTQYWLLQNALDKSEVPKRYFKILLGYMKGLQGNQRQATMAKAQAIVDRYRIEDSNSPSPDANVSRRIYKRAFAILKVLAQ